MQLQVSSYKQNDGPPFEEQAEHACLFRRVSVGTNRSPAVVQTLDSEHPSIASLYLTAAQRQALGKLLPKAASFLRQAATEHQLSSITMQITADDDLVYGIRCVGTVHALN